MKAVFPWKILEKLSLKRFSLSREILSKYFSNESIVCFEIINSRTRVPNDFRIDAKKKVKMAGNKCLR